MTIAFQLFNLFLMRGARGIASRGWDSAGQLRQLAVNLRGRRPGDGRCSPQKSGRNLLQFSLALDTWRLGSVSNQIRPGGGYRFQIDIGGANKADIAVAVEIDAGELGAGSQAVPSGAGRGCDRAAPGAQSAEW
ncbi:hypothetical protein LNP74_29540 [Klebsiella pneumoniae subsp. pneumoniae]|nr:hypothetical protein [Klebsiella pneumoniae subsp. pneumoniae]